MRRRTPKRVARETAEERAYKHWVHARSCTALRYVIDHRSCEGRIEQSHERDHVGLGLKANNLRSVPMCSKAHREWEQRRGVFKGWTTETRIIWMNAAIEAEHADFYGERALWG